MSTSYTLPESIPTILAVLGNAQTGRGNQPKFLTAYQVLNRLPEDWRNWFQSTWPGGSGRNTGVRDSAASRIAQVLTSLVGEGLVEVQWLDTGGVKFHIEGEGDVEPGSKTVCAIYRAL